MRALKDQAAGSAGQFAATGFLSVVVQFEA